MAVLCISNGRFTSEREKLLEGAVWQIDKHTTKIEDSNALRTLNPTAYQRFQSLYPNAGKGSIRLFLFNRYGEESRELLVFYKKHYIAFRKILENPDFMSYYASKESRYLSSSEIRVIEEYPQRLSECMNDLCKKLIENDRCVDGGPLYYSFMRDVLLRYLTYMKEQNAKSIEQIYLEYYRDLQFMSDSISQSRTEILSERFISCHNDSDLDPDYVIYDKMDRLEKRYNKLDGFLGNPHFERYYGDIFNDNYFFVLGSRIQEHEQQEFYQKWYDYAKRGFDGIVVCPVLFKNCSFIDKFEIASIIMFCIFEPDLEVEKMISLALTNGAEVAIQLYDTSLYPKYAKKYPQATILLASMKEEDTLLDETDDFIISCYNHIKEKRYKK